MKVKFFLPILALIFILGMSFTTLKSEGVNNDYVRNNNGTWKAIPEQSCKPGIYTCQVKFSENGQPFDVYDLMDTSTLKESDSPEPTLINP